MATNEYVFLTSARWRRFEAIQRALVPRSSHLEPQVRLEGRRVVDAMIARQNPQMQRKLALFLVIIDLLAWLRFQNGFADIGSENQRKLMLWLFDNPLGLLRKGFWGLNTLAKMSVYGLPAVYNDIGYSVRPTEWQAER